MKPFILTAIACAFAPVAYAQTTWDRPFNEYTWLTAHNAFANTILPNQTLSLRQQLESGVRGLMLDVHESNGRVRLCHGWCLGNEPTLADALNSEVVPFLRRTPNAIVTLHLEDHADRGALAKELGESPDVPGMTFDASTWGHDRWPTPAEMAAAGQRLVIFTQQFGNAGPLETTAGPAHVLYDRDYTSENYWSLGATIFTHDMSCKSRWDGESLSLGLTYGPRTWPRLFVMNHFHGSPFGDHAPTDNSYDTLRSRIDEQCMPAARRKPNYLAVDFVQAGQAASVVGALNAGVIEFFDEPEGKGDRVCAIAAGRRRTVAIEEHAGDRCPPDRLRSAIVRDVPAGMRIELADAATHDAARTLITVKRDLTDSRALVRDLAATQDDADITVRSANGFPGGVLQVTFTQGP